MLPDGLVYFLRYFGQEEFLLSTLVTRLNFLWRRFLLLQLLLMLIDQCSCCWRLLHEVDWQVDWKLGAIQGPNTKTLGLGCEPVEIRDKRSHPRVVEHLKKL